MLLSAMFLLYSIINTIEMSASSIPIDEDDLGSEPGSLHIGHILQMIDQQRMALTATQVHLGTIISTAQANRQELATLKQKLAEATANEPDNTAEVAHLKSEIARISAALQQNSKLSGEVQGLSAQAAASMNQQQSAQQDYLRNSDARDKRYRMMFKMAVRNKPQDYPTGLWFQNKEYTSLFICCSTTMDSWFPLQNNALMLGPIYIWQCDFNSPTLRPIFVSKIQGNPLGLPLGEVLKTLYWAPCLWKDLVADQDQRYRTLDSALQCRNEFQFVHITVAKSRVGGDLRRMADALDNNINKSLGTKDRDIRYQDLGPVLANDMHSIWSYVSGTVIKSAKVVMKGTSTWSIEPGGNWEALDPTNTLEEIIRTTISDPTKWESLDVQVDEAAGKFGTVKSAFHLLRKRDREPAEASGVFGTNIGFSSGKEKGLTKGKHLTLETLYGILLKVERKFFPNRQKPYKGHFSIQYANDTNEHVKGPWIPCFVNGLGGVVTGGFSTDDLLHSAEWQEPPIPLAPGSEDAWISGQDLKDPLVINFATVHRISNSEKEDAQTLAKHVNSTFSYKRPE